MFPEPRGSNDGGKWSEISFDKKMTTDKTEKIYAYLGRKSLNWYTQELTWDE